jgi:Tfp pilus assembly protein PilF
VKWLLIVIMAVALLPAQEPPEEDVNPAEKHEYTFNPLQAAKEMKVGKFYLKKGSYKAAVRRFEEALKWDPNVSEAYLKLGEVHTRLGDSKAAREAWLKYIEAEPDSKEAARLRKKLESK